MVPADPGMECSQYRAGTGLAGPMGCRTRASPWAVVFSREHDGEQAS